MAKTKSKITSLLKAGEQMDPKDVAKTISSALFAEYRPLPKEVGNERFKGKTCYEVALDKAIQKAAEVGDFETVDKLLNRVVGKSVAINASLSKNNEEPEGWLAKVHDKEKRIMEADQI